MTIPLSAYSRAIAAYEQAAHKAMQTPGASAPETPGGGFAELVRDAAADVIRTAEAGERTSIAALRGEADISQVVTAVAEAELTLQTVVAIRDRVIEAYKDIARMPM
ncbi:MAG: flagellar hook-basal body complex protein FliE [Rhodospirillales bacterium]|nr:MAG: flagellar hook-basal body complex protein FliE [Rhodospirillales bacterium]